MNDANTSQRGTILLLDDEHAVVDGLSRVLRRRGFRTIGTHTSSEARAILESRDIDVVISDEQMPGERGSDFLAEVAARWPQTVRVMLSGHATSDTLLRAINHGHVHHFFVKPIAGEVLLAGLRRVLDFQQLEKSSTRLVSVCRAQTRVLEQLERETPGITKVTRDSTGAIVLADVSLDQADRILDEVEQQLRRLQQNNETEDVRA